MIVGSFKRIGIYPVNKNTVSVCSLKPSLTFAGSPAKDSTPRTSSTEKGEVDLKKMDDFQIAFDTWYYIAAISTPVRERYERREAVGYDIEGVSPGYDVYNRLRKNLEKDERNSEGTMVSIEIVSNAPQEEQEVDGLELLAGAAAYITRRECRGDKSRCSWYFINSV